MNLAYSCYLTTIDNCLLGCDGHGVWSVNTFLMLCQILNKSQV